MTHSTRTELGEATLNAVARSLDAAALSERPFRHWMASRVLPADVVSALRALPIATGDLGGVSGKRELHNDTRQYFDAPNIQRFAACAAVADAFQSSEVVGAIERVTGADLGGTFVRLEYAQDLDGFWLEPHTDLGVKRFTMIIYLNEDGASQDDLGTDLFSDRLTWAKRPRFVDNTALIFVPASNTWHGLQNRPIRGVRRSVIMNYVTEDWLAREQLSRPDEPVQA